MTLFSVRTETYNVRDINVKDALIDVKRVFLQDIFKVAKTAKTDYLSGPRPEKLDRVTGNLKASILAAVLGTKNLTGRLGISNSAWYGKLHEEGSGGQKKRPFLAPAIEDHIDEIQRNVLKAISETLERQIK